MWKFPLLKSSFLPCKKVFRKNLSLGAWIREQTCCKKQLLSEMTRWFLAKSVEILSNGFETRVHRTDSFHIKYLLSISKYGWKFHFWRCQIQDNFGKLSKSWRTALVNDFTHPFPENQYFQPMFDVTRLL